MSLAASWERFPTGTWFLGMQRGLDLEIQEMVEILGKSMGRILSEDEFTGRIGFDFSQSNPDVVYALLRPISS